MILHLTPTTAALVGETPAEWQLLEKQVRAGRWTTGARSDEGRLRQLAAAPAGGRSRADSGSEAAPAAVFVSGALGPGGWEG
jgi:hypothetical protein